MNIKKWTWGTGNRLNDGVFTGSLIESALHTAPTERVKTPGMSFTPDELLELNGLKNRKNSFNLASLIP